MAFQAETVPVGPLQVNCYLVWSPATARGVVIDPGARPRLVQEAIGRAGFTPVAVLLTHGHVDHIGAVGAICRHYDIPVFLSQAERALYESPANAVLPWFPAVRDLPAPVHELPACPGLEVTVLPTPGHTPGGVCFYLAAEAVVYTGDTLFAGGVGRTDLPGSSLTALTHSLRQVLYPLPAATRVYPGHGGPTEIGSERLTNPHIRA